MFRSSPRLLVGVLLLASVGIAGQAGATNSLEGRKLTCTESQMRHLHELDMTFPEEGKKQRAAFEAVPESEKDAYCKGLGV